MKSYLIQWKPLVGFETSHLISSDGYVMSLNYNKTGQAKILPLNTDRFGYKFVTIYDWVAKKIRTLKVHRLVAQTFIPNPENLPCVNHKDEDKSNNLVDNLEWCSYSYNSRYGTRSSRMLETKKNNGCSSAPKQVMCVETGIVYPSASEVQRTLGFWRGNVASACRGDLKTAYGYHWKFV